MKTKVEIEGYEIEIQLENGVISVKAEKDDEVVEEFTIEIEEGQSQEEDSDEVQGFEEFGGEEDDFEGEESEEEGEESEEEGDERGLPALESFQSFINKRK
jgi:hypothetical protein